ncbi:UvrD/REP helicase [Magnetococcus marinus MC-1]|uniref:DNA 3'-5' helicase n=1 Tax=Magnetococcus marinus (strain ATCC BAA-1437 / JCM 17883 / MC-1) TaxID=156889 RepID=A0L7C0_MAGMM|nr:UvrD-helicase domain-containing protein [Magnetococcus marinus]ABK43863.1 UvrD/REP helicase [Magnetococcus marinus MC-1]
MAAMKIKVAIASDFLSAFSKIPRKQQNKVMDFIDKFRDNPMSPGINYEKINAAKDTNLRSVRIDNTYRAIVLSPEAGNVYLLLWVDHHDAAYDWASRRVCNVHPETGSLQVIEVETTTVTETKAIPAPEQPVGMFAEIRDRQLVSLGIPETLIDLVRTINDEDELDAMSSRMPEEAYDALVMLAAGYSVEQVDQELVAASAEAVDTADFAAALETPDSKRRFYVVDDEMELKAILSAPLEKWRVFLHPSQHKLVNRDWNGPVRVLGGAGTGKTVVALHRAKWLAQTRCQDGRKRVLFTTFTRNLAADIKANLRKICGEETFSRIEVTNLDRWVSEFLRKNGYEFEIDFGRRTGPLWEKALTMMPSDLGYEPSFYREEWEQVIQPQGITTVTDYFKAPRLGRGTRLNRKARKEVWAVFEEYRYLLDENGLREPDDAMRDALQLLDQKGHDLPYCAVVVDEAQDMGHQAFRLIRRLVPDGDEVQNDIFIVGDGHQRIYRHKVVLGQCGVNIRGRSRKLRINYRTTEENRRWAVGLLEGVPVDDLDGGADDQKGYKSLLHGEQPAVHHFKTAKEESDHIVSLLKECEANGQELSTVCIVARTNGILEQYKAELEAAGIKTHMIHRGEAEKRSVTGVRLATMHRIKGLEFETIIVGSVNEGIVPFSRAVTNTDDPVVRKESENRERALLYVAATRAKRQVVVCSYGRASQFIQTDN